LKLRVALFHCTAEWKVQNAQQFHELKKTAVLGRVCLWNFRPGWQNYIFVSDMKIILDDNNFYLDFNKFNSYCSILYRLF